jgi:hypothetical protein
MIANPNVHVYSFDLGNNPYVQKAKSFIDDRFPGRLTLTMGDSTATVPKFFADHPNLKCDIISVDGGHSFDVATADILNFKVAAHECTTLFIDDTNCKAHWCVDAAMNAQIEAAVITSLRHITESDGRGVTLLWYML